MNPTRPRSADALTRFPAVAGSFYPADRGELAALVDDLLAEAARLPGAEQPVRDPLPTGLLVPHAGLVYSGVTAAAAWRLLADTDATVVVLGTNHSSRWLDGVGTWPAGAWRTPLGEVAVEERLAAAAADLGPPFAMDPECHAAEHSIEVQLPLLAAVAPGSRLVPLAVSTGTGADARDAGHRLGLLLRRWRDGGERVVLVISSDMAHYPPAAEAAAVTEALLPSLLALDPVALAVTEARIRQAPMPGVACGMCGIEPAVLGLAALRAMGATRASVLATATSADAGAPATRTVGYLALRFDG